MRLYKALVFVVLWIQTCASLAQTAETFDTSKNPNAVSEQPIQQATSLQVTPEYEEDEPKETYEDPNNPGVFITQGKKVKNGNAPSHGEITFGEIRSESKLQNSAMQAAKSI